MSYRFVSLSEKEHTIDDADCELAEVDEDTRERCSDAYPGHKEFSVHLSECIFNVIARNDSEA